MSWTCIFSSVSGFPDDFAAAFHSVRARHFPAKTSTPSPVSFCNAPPPILHVAHMGSQNLSLEGIL